MRRGQLHSKQVLKASLIILPLTPRPGHVTQAADELEEMEGGGGEDPPGGVGGCERADWLPPEVPLEVSQSEEMTRQ